MTYFRIQLLSHRTGPLAPAHVAMPLPGVTTLSATPTRRRPACGQGAAAAGIPQGGCAQRASENAAADRPASRHHPVGCLHLQRHRQPGIHVPAAGADERTHPSCPCRPLSPRAYPVVRQQPKLTRLDPLSPVTDPANARYLHLSLPQAADASRRQARASCCRWIPPRARPLAPSWPTPGPSQTPVLPIPCVS